MGSANLAYHWRAKPKDRKFEPFVTAGYTRFFRAGTSQGASVGGGVNFRLSDHAGLRLEVRDNATRGWETVRFGGGAHFLALRIGLTFR